MFPDCFNDSQYYNVLSNITGNTYKTSSIITSSTGWAKQYFNEFAQSYQSTMPSLCQYWATIVNNMPSEDRPYQRSDSHQEPLYTFVPTGLQNHGTSILVRRGTNYDYVAITNKGHLADPMGTTIFCRVSKSQINENYINNCTKKKYEPRTEQEYLQLIGTLMGHNRVNVIGSIRQRQQKTGNCGWVNLKSAYLAFLVFEHHFYRFEQMPNDQPPFFNTQALCLPAIWHEYKVFSSYAREQVMDRLYNFNAYNSACVQFDSHHLRDHLFSCTPSNIAYTQSIYRKLVSQDYGLRLVKALSGYLYFPDSSLRISSFNILVLCNLYEVCFQDEQLCYLLAEISKAMDVYFSTQIEDKISKLYMHLLGEAMNRASYRYDSYQAFEVLSHLYRFELHGYLPAHKDLTNIIEFSISLKCPFELKCMLWDRYLERSLTLITPSQKNVIKQMILHTGANINPHLWSTLFYENMSRQYTNIQPLPAFVRYQQTQAASMPARPAIMDDVPHPHPYQP